MKSSNLLLGGRGVYCVVTSGWFPFSLMVYNLLWFIVVSMHVCGVVCHWIIILLVQSGIFLFRQVVPSRETYPRFSHEFYVISSSASMMATVESLSSPSSSVDGSESELSSSPLLVWCDSWMSVVLVGFFNQLQAFEGLTKAITCFRSIILHGSVYRRRIISYIKFDVSSLSDLWHPTNPWPTTRPLTWPLTQWLWS